MSFTTIADLENAASGSESKAPWFKFPKGANGRIDPNADSVKFRLLDELSSMMIARQHYDNDIRKPVMCNKVASRGADGRYWFNGVCEYCDLRKAHKEAFNADPRNKGKYPDKKWDMQCTLVAKIALGKYNSDGDLVSQEFALMPFKAKDAFYPNGGGFYKFLSSQTANKAKANKKITEFWWELTPDFMLSQVGGCTKPEMAVTFDPYDIMTVAPYEYAKAMKDRQALKGIDELVQQYDTVYDEKKPDENEVSYSEEFDEENPPF